MNRAAPLADDGFGNLVSAANPFGTTTSVFARIGGRVATFDVGTGDHEQAIDVVRNELVRAYGDQRLSKSRWKLGPVLALVSRRTA